METLIHHPSVAASMFPDPYANYCWLIPADESNKGSIINSTLWTKEENKMFESALAIYDEKTPQRWEKVAAMLPGKSVWDVIRQYKTLEEDVCDIEAGLIPLPGYITTPSGSAAAGSFTLEWVGNGKQLDSVRKKGAVSVSSMAVASRPLEQERRKGVPWTEDEHRRFLLGLQKHGKGDWRNISRNYVISKTPTQVASHAQKYFLRQVSGGKDKRRPSIHDITTTNLLGGNFLPLDVKKTYNHYQQQQHSDDDQSDVLSSQQQKHNTIVLPRNRIVFEWGHQNNDELEQHTTMVLDGVIAGM